MWFLDRLNPGSPVYNMSGALQIRGILDLGILEKSLNEIVRRHEIWRTNFRFLEGEATQVVRANRNLKLKLIKLQQLSSEAQQAEVIHQVNREAQKPFDLERGSLLRATLWQLGEDNNVLLLNVHHI
ncbi:MAG: condensation domain-containing protein, partial [Cyanobacteria bacterium J06639_18]